MSGFGWAISVGLGISAMGVVVYGCAFNPFSTPGYDERPSVLGGDGGTAGMSGQGGSSGQGSSSGEGGTGGTVCMCVDDAKECTNDVSGVCPGGDAAACHSARYGAKCSSGGCNEMGECVSCLECDSPECFARCEKMACTEDAQCAKGFCEQKTCCDKECVGPCKACDRLGTEGSCTRMPRGLAVCKPGLLCDNKGQCIPDAKVALGGLCTLSTDCASGLCRREYCQSQVGEPCVEDIECTTNLCDPTTHTCKSCIGAEALKCPVDTTCNMQYGWCTVLPGQPAGADEECSKGERLPHRCLLQVGASCTNHDQCIYRNCLGDGTCSGQCMNAGQCVAGTPCVGNVCKLAVGSNCMLNIECESNNCSGFPRRCQP